MIIHNYLLINYVMKITDLNNETCDLLYSSLSVLDFFSDAFSSSDYVVLNYR